MRRMRRALITSLLAGLVALPPAVAAAAQPGQITLVPPGHSGASQYFETIPTSAGDAPPPQGGPAAGTGSLGRLGDGRAGAARLAKFGRDGASAAALAEATAPTPAPSGSQARPGTGATRLGSHPVPPAPRGGSSLGGLISALTGSDAGGLGIALPLLLAATLVAAIAVGSRRLRQRGAQGPSST
jgi:hypothetical protein